MAHLPINFGGGSGNGSDDCTAQKKHVLSPYTAITGDSDDEAEAGAMPDKTGWSSSGLAAGASVTIPEGYHDGKQKVTAKDLASQTAGTATKSYILKGKTAWVDGSKLTGSMEVSSVPSFSVAPYSTSQLVFTWKNPAQASGRPFSGVIIRWKTGSYPTSPTDGSGYMGSGSSSVAGATSSVTLGGFTAGTTYYCRIWAYCICSAGNYTVNNTKVLVSSGYKDATGTPTAHGRKAFTASGTWTVPAGVRSINVHCTGGGGSGHYDNNDDFAGGGGGGGYTSYQKNIAVEPGDVVTFIVGAGGTVHNPTSEQGQTGGDTTVSIDNTAKTSITANGGRTVASGNIPWGGGKGGSGGGRGADVDDIAKYWDAATAGASDGGSSSGSGQGTTTREFGDESRTLYSGGGGGGGAERYDGGSEENFVFKGAAGGSGGGGAGGNMYVVGSNGSAGTGGGGGGFGLRAPTSEGGNGGSGNVIITW